MAPRATSFESAYAKTPDDVDTATLDSSLRSYMDSGEDLFADETVDGKKRNAIVAQVRSNILRRMSQENQASMESALVQRNKHRAVSEKIKGKVNEVKRLKREIIITEAEYAAMLGKNDTGDKEWSLGYIDEMIRDAEADQAAERQLLNEEAPREVQVLDQTGNDVSEDTAIPGNPEPNTGEVLDLVGDDGRIDADDVEEAEHVEIDGVNPVERVRRQDEAYVRSDKSHALTAGETSRVSIDERQSDIEYLRAIREGVRQTDVAHKGRFRKFISSIGIFLSSKRSQNDKKAGKIRKLTNEAEALADNWAEKRADYREKIYRKHYDNYDKMAKSWYEMTQEFSVDENGELSQEARESRTIPETSAKSIVEYTGIYDTGPLIDLFISAEKNPYLNVGELPVTESTETNQDGANLVDPALHTKTHTKIAMYSQAGEGGLKTRYKFGRDLTGRRSKRQFTAESPTALTAAQGTDEHFFDEVYAGRADLESDELDINGRKLFSERSAEILHAKLKKNGERVHGFYLNGEFFTDEEAAEGETVGGKDDMKYFGRRSWTKQEKAERLRVAIRQSAFFQHVNAATIQYYTSYAADDDYTEGIKTAIAEKWQEAAKKDGKVTPHQVVETLSANPGSIDKVPEALKGSAIYLYVKNKITLNPPPEKPFPVSNPASDPVISHAKGNRPVMLSAMTQMLADDDSPELWKIARGMILGIDEVVDPRTYSMLDNLPKEGMMMRMGLLDELINHQGAFSEFDSDLVLGFIKIPGLSVTQQELENKRGL
ncbi:MAG: hypothetical protein K5985_12250, partial [Lachnospiraceae bacterium]|nr:hypothetical protein [Lachnospiraceae bacterium]